jgi:hypothetical protein
VEAGLLWGCERRDRGLGEANRHVEGRLLWLPGVRADGEDGGRRHRNSKDEMLGVTRAWRGWDLAGTARG